ncbi:MAG: LuxR C-terminal-related transcriptional regulator [Chloroflexota bacterium]
MSAAPSHVNPVLLLQTKLYRPQVYPDLIERPFLINRLNQGLHGKLTLVAAPAGYGKSTIVTQWLHSLEAQPHQIAWFSLDESDNDLLLFLQYLVTAVRQIQHNSCINTLAALQNPQPLPWSQLATLLLNDLFAITAPLILVLDDYHYVTSEVIHQLLDKLLDHLPPAHHFVLISRTEPPLALPRLRVRRQMNELRTVDLSFSRTETKTYFTQDMPNTLAPETIATIQERSEGWIAGLYLTKLSLGRSINEQTLLKQLQGSNAHILDYLMSEVLALQTQAVQTFLLYTAILRRFCYPLCKALLENMQPPPLVKDAQASKSRTSQLSHIIDQLARYHLFTIPLDDSGTWYRYHHLFQLMLTRRLQKQITPSQINSLHQKASRWYAQEGLIDEALHHALAATDTPFAVQLIEQHLMKRMNQFDYHTLERWLALLPKTTIKQRPHLILQEYWISLKYLQMTLVASFQHVQQAEACLDNSDLALDETEQAILRAEITAVRVSIHYWRGEYQQVLNYYQQAILALPKSYVLIRLRITLYAAYALQYQGQATTAIRLMQESLKSEVITSNRLLVWFRSYLAPFYYSIGDLSQAAQVVQDTFSLLDEQARNQPFNITSRLYHWSGIIHYEWNDLGIAKQHFLKVDSAYPLSYYSSQLSLSWLYEAEGRTDTAQQLISELHQWALAKKSNWVLNEIASYQARRFCWQGHVELARQTLDDVSIDEFTKSLAEIPLLTKAWVLSNHDREESWYEAESLLDKRWAISVEKWQSTPSQIRILALRALLYQRQGRLDEALTLLEQSIKLAKPSRFIRTFVDLGKLMAALLSRLLEQGVELDYLSKILAAFPHTAPQQSERIQRSHQESQKQRVEPLTKREMDVLLLLAQELSNKKIAQQLSISPLTVKRHTINIYQKLSVSNRHDAVHAAKALGIVPS